MAIRHRDRISTHFGPKATGSFPLFCTVSGGCLSKRAVILIIREAARLAGSALTEDNEFGEYAERFAEHTLRVAGAQFLARLGLELYLIQLIGRWGGSSITRYVQSAPLCRLERVSMLVNKGRTDSDTPSAALVTTSLRAEIEKIRSDMASLGTHGATERERSLVLNCDTNCTHKHVPEGLNA